MRVSRAQVLAHRLAAHHLDARLPAGRWRDALRPLGLRTAVPGTAEASLHARVDGVTAGLLAGALAAGDLVEVRSAHGTHVVPPEDVDVFTVGAVPTDERSLRSGMRRIGGLLGSGDRRPAAVLDRARAAAVEALAAGALDTGELSAALTARLPGEFSPYCRACATHHVDNGLFGYVLLGERIARRPGDGRLVRLTDLPGQAVTGGEPDHAAAHAGLVRRLLHGHGPSTAAELAWWLCVPQRDAEHELAALADELVEVDYDGRTAHLLAADQAALAAAEPVPGVRLVPPYDPLLTTDDPATLAPAEDDRRDLWRVVANSGAVVADGEVVAGWRGRKTGRRLDVTLTPYAGWRPRFLAALRAEAQAVAALRGCDAGRVADPAG